MYVNGLVSTPCFVRTAFYLISDVSHVKFPLYQFIVVKYFSKMQILISKEVY